MIELLVVIAIIAILAALLLPALSSAKAKAYRVQCLSQLKQLSVGIMLFTADHSDMYPPAGFSIGASTGPSYQASWDSYIHRYIGGRLGEADLDIGVIDTEYMPKILRCPGDRKPEQPPSWTANYPGVFGRRTYAMNAVGPNWGTQYQVPTQNRRYPLPDLSQPTVRGIGLYWTDTSGRIDWEARSYTTAAVRDAARTILLVEQPCANNVAGNIWPCISFGPQSPAGMGQGNGELYQIAKSDPLNYGDSLYQLHGQRFNYLFIDGHTETLKLQETIGTGTLTYPRGLWTIFVGD